MSLPIPAFRVPGYLLSCQFVVYSSPKLLGSGSHGKVKSLFGMDITELLYNQYEALKKKDFKGHDPYDGLNSRILRNSPCFRSRALRLAWIQLFKRSPVNLRSLALVPAGSNPKGLALLIRGLINLRALTGREEFLQVAHALADKIIAQRARDRSYFCIGYDFFWEARAFSVPEFTPNMVVSASAAQAFLDLYDAAGDAKWLDYALQIGEFVEKELILVESAEEMVFGYVPGESGRVHNVNLMGAALFARLFSHTGQDRHRQHAVKAARYSIRSQREDGSWLYGESPHHRWVDNFHTGFNLVALHAVHSHLPGDMWRRSIDSGLDYHVRHHFTEDMTPKYYDSKLYPIDIHNFAQGIDTFVTFDRPDSALRLIERCVDTMWDKRKHYFYYQKTKWYTNRIDYLRWSQAWMFFALTRYQLDRDHRERARRGDAGGGNGRIEEYL
jgi:hypothetical protein